MPPQLALALGLAALALFVAAVAFLRAKAARVAADDAAREARRAAGQVGDEVHAELETLRALVATMADGGPVDGDMVREGRAWREVDVAVGVAMAAEEDVVVVDVRTPDETRSGVVPGALRIPLDELDERKGEVPRTGRRVLVYCAGGGRSAAACEHLSNEGWEGLVNLAGGFGEWNGPVARPEEPAS